MKSLYFYLALAASAFLTVPLVSAEAAEALKTEPATEKSQSSSCSSTKSVCHVSSFSSSSSSSSAAAAQEVVDNSSPKCRRKLEEIVYIPKTAAYDYLVGVMTELAQDIGAIDDVYKSVTADSILKTIAKKYGVSIVLQPPFKGLGDILYTPTGGSRIIIDRAYGHILAPTYLNQYGFEYNSKPTKPGRSPVDYAAYSLSLFLQSGNGVGLTIIIYTNAIGFVPGC